MTRRAGSGFTVMLGAGCQRLLQAGRDVGACTRAGLQHRTPPLVLHHVMVSSASKQVMIDRYLAPQRRA